VEEDPSGLSMDPTLRKIGIVTLEDLVEEILQEEIEDERENMREERKKLRQQLAFVFSDRHASDVLNRAELIAVREYLEIELPVFGRTNLSLESLQKLIEKSYVLDIESDSRPFNHNLLATENNKKRSIGSTKEEDDFAANGKSMTG
jgi:hypothetical protein